MSGIRQGRVQLNSSPVEKAWDAANGPSAEALKLLTDVLNHLSVGVALYDRRLRCLAANRALATISGVPATKHIGKTFSEVFGRGAQKVDAVLQRVFEQDNPFQNFEVTTPPELSMKPGRFLTSFCPIRDGSRRVRLVTATFSKVVAGKGKASEDASGPSARERQVLGLLAEGKSNKEAAAILDLSPRTVEAYRARLMAKLNLHSVADLVRYALLNNLVPV